MIVSGGNTPFVQHVARLAAHPRFAAYRYRAWRKQHSVYEPFLKKAEVSLLLTSGSIPIHEDSWELPPYSYHLMVVNDGYIAKGPQQKPKDFPVQLPGVIVCLNIHEPHHVIRNYKPVGVYMQGSQPVWCSLCFNVSEPILHEEAERRFADGIQETLLLMDEDTRTL